MPLLQWRLAVWATNNFLPALRTESDDHQLSRVWHRAGARMEVLHDLRTAGHVDLWLHGYAMLTGDTARVPFFRRGYRQRMRELRASRSVYTQLDANADKLSSRFLANPSLVNGQLLPFYFTSFQQIQQITDIFLQTGGDPRSTTDPTTQQLFAVLNNAFPTAPDRDLLRLYVQSLAEENTRF